ncbi:MULTISPECIES: hypothetical protein [Burkholderia]|uniref:Uncharacterized protein n=1 Tax=Burkholderia paludis TaxID=1506587 RepID=A0A6P2RJF2_9BURK|nr:MULTISPECIES: hypothetical protein [Burkholderia]CAB3768170.1 hypothetical protein LMG30113_05654 [Burkholderia paludis]VWC30411.1 hypothetical protein BPA30113_06254 [Burkholderia paludis]
MHFIDGQFAKRFKDFIHHKRYDILAAPCSTLAEFRRAVGLEKPLIYN